MGRHFTTRSRGLRPPQTPAAKQTQHSIHLIPEIFQREGCFRIFGKSPCKKQRSADWVFVCAQSEKRFSVLLGRGDQWGESHSYTADWWGSPGSRHCTPLWDRSVKLQHLPFLALAARQLGEFHSVTTPANQNSIDTWLRSGVRAAVMSCWNALISSPGKMNGGRQVWPSQSAADQT